MPVRIADIELWSSLPIGRCWRDGLKKRLVGSVALTRTSSFAARDLLLEDAGIRIAEALRGCVCRGGVDCHERQARSPRRLSAVLRGCSRLCACRELLQCWAPVPLPYR
jgi:hypothetical protein